MIAKRGWFAFMVNRSYAVPPPGQPVFILCSNEHYDSLSGMKITVTRPNPSRFELRFDDTTVVLDGSETKTLLLELTKHLVPGNRPASAQENRFRSFARKLCQADDVGVQTLLLKADADDILVILKAGEDDSQLRGRIYANMTEKARIIAEEDLRYKFREGVGEDRITAATERIERIVKDLVEDGVLRFNRAPR